MHIYIYIHINKETTTGFTISYIYIYNQYYCNRSLYNLVFIALFVMEHHWKNLMATWELEPASPLLVNRNAMFSTIIHPIKRMDASSPEQSNTVFSHSPNANSHIMIDAIFDINQYYCNRSLYINYIYRIICHGTSLKNRLGHVGSRTCIAGLSQQTCYIALSTIIHPPPQKKNASSPELNNTVFCYSS